MTVCEVRCRRSTSLGSHGWQIRWLSANVLAIRERGHPHPNGHDDSQDVMLPVTERTVPGAHALHCHDAGPVQPPAHSALHGLQMALSRGKYDGGQTRISHNQSCTCEAGAVELKPCAAAHARNRPRRAAGVETLAVAGCARCAVSILQRKTRRHALGAAARGARKPHTRVALQRRWSRASICAQG